ncbi:ATP-binding protein [Streptomyces nojiriensis]
MRQTVPAELSSFIGRERELAAVAKLLAVERLVTLTGPAGIGKTRLAVRTVRSLTSTDGIDVCWAEAARVDPPRLPELEAGLAAALAGREVLLVLDGCEQLPGQARGLAGRLLAALPGLRILATSQRRLWLREEVEVAVPPLSLPPGPVAVGGHGGPGAPAERMPVAEMAGYAAVRLFEERARGADPFFVLTERNAADVAALCRALDGIPGALELAAGRSHQYAPDQALRRLAADPLTFLAGGAGRGTRVDAERSYRLAPPAERLVRERLSVFAGSFDLAAAAEVCGFGVLTREGAAEVLRDLVPGLLADGGPGRYRLPLSVRAHAARRLAHGPAGDGTTASRRHHERCRVLAEKAAQLWREGAQEAARELALRELPELRAAMNPLSATGPAAALEIAVSLWFLWSACGLTEEGRRHVERALALHPAPRPARALWLAAWLVASLGEAAAADPLLVEAWSAAVQEGRTPASPTSRTCGARSRCGRSGTRTPPGSSWRGWNCCRMNRSSAPAGRRCEPRTPWPSPTPPRRRARPRTACRARSRARRVAVAIRGRGPGATSPAPWSTATRAVRPRPGPPCCAPWEP